MVGAHYLSDVLAGMDFAFAAEYRSFDKPVRMTDGDDMHVPIVACLDVGHMCVPGTSGDDRARES